mgnify:CR=1 FL=1
MLLSLEMHNVGAFVVSEAGATRKSCMGLGQSVCRGQRTWQTGNGGSPRTWEILSSPPEERLWGLPHPKTPGRLVFDVSGRSKRMTRRTEWYRQAKENEARRDGWQEVVAS